MNSKKILLSIFASMFLLTSCEDDSETVDNYYSFLQSAQAFNAEHVMGTLTYNFSISDSQAGICWYWYWSSIFMGF